MTNVIQFIILGQDKTHCDYTTEGCSNTQICLYDLVYTWGKKIKNYYLKMHKAFEMHYFLQLVNYIGGKLYVLAPSGWTVSALLTNSLSMMIVANKDNAMTILVKLAILQMFCSCSRCFERLFTYLSSEQPR